MNNCTWTEVDEYDYETTCGYTLLYDDETPTDYKFCPYCGKPLEVAELPEEVEE